MKVGFLSQPCRPRHKLDGENRCLCGCFVCWRKPTRAESFGGMFVWTILLQGKSINEREISRGGDGTSIGRGSMVSSWRCVTAEKAESKGTDCSRIRGTFCQELGAHFDGVARTMGPSPERLIKLVQATIWLLGRKVMARRW